MTPKEKANEIFSKHYISIFNINCDYSEECLISNLAQKHAIITVDEILNNGGLGRLMDEWWREVKTEIEKL